mgnify:CR=1 FL=1
MAKKEFKFIELDQSKLPVTKGKKVDGFRFYDIEGKGYPSVTTVLGIRSKEGLQKWRDSIGEKVANWEMNRAARRGKATHTLVEQYIKNETPSIRDVLPLGLFRLLKPYIDQIDNKKKYFKNIIKKVSNIINKNDDVMEIGSYYGAFGSEIINHVNSYTGLELSTHASKYSKDKFNLNVVNESIYKYFENNEKKFDIIFMFDVLEHLDDPNAILNLCSKNLKKDGRLICSTMNMDSIFAKVTGRYYPWIIPMHKFYFSNNSVKKFLNKNNLDLKEIITDVRIIGLEYLFLKISQKIPIFKYFYNLLIKFKILKNTSIKFSLFDINIYCAYKN